MCNTASSLLLLLRRSRIVLRRLAGWYWWILIVCTRSSWTAQSSMPSPCFLADSVRACLHLYRLVGLPHSVNSLPIWDRPTNNNMFCSLVNLDDHWNKLKQPETQISCNTSTATKTWVACGNSHLADNDACKYKVHKFHQRYMFMYLVFTRMPGESYCRPGK